MMFLAGSWRPCGSWRRYFVAVMICLSWRWASAVHVGGGRQRFTSVVGVSVIGNAMAVLHALGDGALTDSGRRQR